MSKLDLSTEICGVKLKNPTILASGILGIGSDLLVRVAKSGAGAVTSKSCCLLPREGHKNPILVEMESGFLNAVGLPNPGVEEEVEALKEAKKKINSSSVLIASFFADTTKNFGRVAKIISEADPDLLEVNISCPNTSDDLGRNFAEQESSAAAVTKEVKKNTKIPIIVKLAPNVPNIGGIAQAVVEAGADAISAINAMPGMKIDLESGKPVLTNRIGGMSGPMIKPLAVRCVWEICKVVKVPVIGIGGITTGEDAAEMIMAGAKAVGIGSAVYYRGIDVFKKVSKELAGFMEKRGYKKLEDFRGLALQD
jgi:dihydroorotate dehydrogenase (NAD+) catalytic subunit